MYKSRYVEKTRKNSEGILLEKSQLVAKFKFRKDVAPKDRKVVRERIKAQTDSWHQSPSMTGGGFNSFAYKGDYWKYFLSFEIKVCANHKLTQEERPDLKAIDDYILNGNWE